jgi:hypothetical protein
MARRSNPWNDVDSPRLGLLSRVFGRRTPSADTLSQESVFPLNRSDQRTLDPEFSGVIYTWDIDKTYLDTEFHSLSELLLTAVEFAVDKRAIAGTVPLLRGIRRGPTASSRLTPLYFVSASPPQLRGVLERKMLLDGVDSDGVTLKDQLALAMRGRFRQIKEQAGYKLTALLLNRRAHPPRAHEILFGDDSESDAFVYSTYARILAGQLRGPDLVSALVARGVTPDGAAHVASLAHDLPVADAVRRIFIHLAVGKPTVTVEREGPLVAATHSPLQPALALWEQGEIDEATVAQVLAAQARRGGDAVLGAIEQIEDAAARGLVTAATATHWLSSGLASPQATG